MLHQLRALSGLAVVVAIAGVTFSAAADSGYVGKPFPNFTAKDPVNGRDFSLRDFQGKVVLIDFWATWCGPCVKELPKVKRAYRKYHDEGLEIISISLDSDRRRFDQFVSRQKMDWTHVMDGGRWGTRLAKKYNIKSIPAMFLLDHEGVCISDSVRGGRLEPAIAAALKKLPRDVSPSAGAPGESREAETSAMITELKRELEAAREDLHAATESLRQQGDRLDIADDTIEGIGRQLPVPRDPQAVNRQFAGLLDDLAELRHELFVCGFLNERPVELPSNPFAGDRVDVQRACLALEVELDKARRAVGDMRHAIGNDLERIRSTERELRDAQRVVSRDRVTPRVLSSSRDLLVQADALQSRCRDAWQRQLEQADDWLARLTGAGKDLEEALAAIETQIEECEKDLGTSSRDRSAARRLRDNFAAVCESIEAVTAGLGGSGALELPTNPFEQGSARDVRTRVEARQQLARARATLEAMRKLSEGGIGEQGFSAEVETLRNEFAAAEQDSKRLARVEQEFNELCHRILSAMDGDEST